MFRRVMVAYDESQEAGKALQTAIGLAKALNAQLSVVTVIEPLPTYYSFAVSALPATAWREEKQARYASLHAKARRQAKAAGIWLDTELVNGDEVSTIIECARKYRADLLVLGMRKHTFLMGHTARDIAEQSPCALMGVR
jgi:nucleotide-binding universal stress UspA family protein